MSQQQYPYRGGQPGGNYQHQGQWQQPAQSSFGGWGGTNSSYQQGFQQPYQHQGYGQQTQQPNWQYQSYQQFQPPAPQPKPKRPTGLLAAIGVAAVVLVGLMFVAFNDSSPTEVGVEYQNEDYELPQGEPTEIPIPETVDELETWVFENPLYSETLASPVNCSIQLDGSTVQLADTELESRLNEYLDCLTRVWGPSLEAAGWDPYVPVLSVYPAGSTVNTPCGTAESFNAFWCSADQNLYLAPDLLELLPEDTATSRIVMEYVIAHEYGHAVQGRAGLAASIYYAEEAAETDADALQISRMYELQADCMAGEAVNSLSDALGVDADDRALAGKLAFDLGDDELARRFDVEVEAGNHGTGTNRELWADRGLNSLAVQTCVTYTAPASETD